MKTNEERVRDLLAYLGGLSHVKPEDIPDIVIYGPGYYLYGKPFKRHAAAP